MRAKRLDLFGRFCAAHLRIESGARLVLEPVQERVLDDYFSGVRELVTLQPKKTGKTSLVAGVSIFELVTNPDFRIAIAANARDQAQRTHDQATGFIRRSSWLHERLHSTKREIRSRRAEGRIEILAADTDHVDGWIGNRAFVDELHRAASLELYGILSAGVGPLGGQIWTFSTAGSDETSALGEIRRAAYEMPGFRQDGPYKHVRTPGFAFHELSLDQADDYADMSLVKRVHPSWVTVDDLRAAYESPTMSEWFWRRFYCGQWVMGSEDAAIASQEWAACADPDARIPDGARSVFVGIDLGWKWDCTAFVPVWREAGASEPRSVYENRFLSPEERQAREEQEERAEGLDSTIIVGEPVILTPPQDGTSLDHEDVFAVAQMYDERYANPTFVLDPEAGGEQFGQRVESELGLRVVTHSQKTTPMCAASQRLAELVSSGKIRHPDHPELTAHVLAATAKFVGPMWRLAKPKGKKSPIDGAVALAMACEALSSQPPATVFLGWL